MKKDISFEVDKRFWDEAATALSAALDADREDIERGILFFLGKHCGDYLETFCGDVDKEMLKEVKIAIIHSKQEK